MNPLEANGLPSKVIITDQMQTDCWYLNAIICFQIYWSRIVEHGAPPNYESASKLPNHWLVILPSVVGSCVKSFRKEGVVRSNEIDKWRECYSRPFLQDYSRNITSSVVHSMHAVKSDWKRLMSGRPPDYRTLPKLPLRCEIDIL